MACANALSSEDLSWTRPLPMSVNRKGAYTHIIFKGSAQNQQLFGFRGFLLVTIHSANVEMRYARVIKQSHSNGFTVQTIMTVNLSEVLVIRYTATGNRSHFGQYFVENYREPKSSKAVENCTEKSAVFF